MSKLALFLIAAASLRAQDQRHVVEPLIPPVCSSLIAANSWPLHEDSSDTARIQTALDRCASGSAVELKASGTKDSFLSGALNLRRGVTLLVDSGVTLYASRNPKDFELTPGSCGVITEKGHGCRALLNGNNVPGAAIMGDGVIDGRGGEKILGQQITWWQLADQARSGGLQNNPRLVQLQGCND